MRAAGEEVAVAGLREALAAARGGSSSAATAVLDRVERDADELDEALRREVVAWLADGGPPMPRALRAAIALVRSAVRGEARGVWGRLLVLSRERGTSELGIAAANAITWAVIDNPDLWVDGEAGRWMAQINLPATRDACIASLPRRWAGEF